MPLVEGEMVAGYTICDRWEPAGWARCISPNIRGCRDATRSRSVGADCS